MSSTMEDLGYLTCLCLLDLYHPLELTAVTMHDDHFHILDNTSTNPENDAVPELTVDALEVIELAVIVIPCPQHTNISIEYRTIPVNLDCAIETIESSLLSISPRDRKARIMRYGLISRLRHQRWTRSSENGDLAAATSYLRSCTLCPDLDPFHQAIFYAEMGMCLHSRYSLHKEPLIVESAIDSLQKSVTLMRRCSQQKPLIFFITQLARLFFSRFQDVQEIRDLNQSIIHLREGTNLFAADNVALASCYGHLVHELSLKFELFQNRSDLEDAILSHETMGKLPQRSTKHVDGAMIASSRRIAASDDWRTTHTNLLFLRFMDTGQLQDLQSAIEMAEDVLQGCPDEKPPLREEVSTCLVNCLMQRFRVHGRVEDLRRIEELVLHDSARSIDNVHILGKLLITAFDWFRHQEFIDEAVKYSHLSVIAMSSTLKTRIPTPQDGIPEAEELEELTFAQAALQQLYNAEFAARYTQQSWWQEVLSPGSRMRPVNSWVEETSRLHDLGCAITKQFAVSPLRDNRQMSIALTVLRLAEQLAPRNSSQRWEYLFSLGTSHRVRHEIVQQPGWKDIKRAVELQSKAVEKLLVPNPRRIPALSSLACSLLQLAQASGDETQYYRAVELLEHVADAFYGFIHDRLEGAILWASLLHSDTPFSFEDEQTQLQRALEGYKKAISLLARAVWIGLSTSSRLARLHSVPKTFASDAAACAIRLAELQSDPQRRQQYLGTAVELLDQGRAILWSQASQLHADLRLLSTRQPELAAELNGVAAELARTAFKDGNADSGNATADLAYKWDELVDRVRQLDGFHDFLRSTPFAALRQAAGPTTIIIVNVSEHRCDTIIIPSQGAVRLVPLPKLSKSQVDDNVQDIHSLLPSKDDRGEFETIAHDLWGDICQPVLAELREMGIVDQSPRSSGVAPHIRWCLTGRLAFLPIHAAGPRYQSRRKPGMLDWVTSSYISTLSMLLRAQQRREALQGQVPVPRVLAVCHSGGDERGRLPKAKEEVEILCSCLKPGAASVIMDKAARVDAVSDALKKSNWVHFACHGTQNKTNPMDSALVLDDGRLPVSKLAEQNLKGEFAMLLACETAMGMPGLSDEAIHVAAGLHFAGFNSVVATMWSICDEHGPIVAGKVYKYLFRKKEDGSPADALEAAQALRKALLFLRDKQKLSVRDWAPFMHFGL